jgi:hypothetical protein
MTVMHLKSSVAVLTGVVAVLLMISGSGLAAAPAATPQRNVSEQWVAAITRGDQRSACELQSISEVAGRSCASLPSKAAPAKCPKAGPGAKPNYRKSEIRTTAEQVGAFTEENPTQGFVRIYSQVKSRKGWGALGLEQIAGSWKTTYLRFGGQSYAPAGTSYEGEAWEKLWLGRASQCPTLHPQWEKKRH